MSAADHTMAAPTAIAGRRQGSGMGGEHLGREAGAIRHHRVQLALGIVALVAALVLVIVGALNRSLQAEVAAGQARIANAQAAANVNNTLIRLLAKAAAEKKDEQIRALLSQNGISFRQTAPGAPDAAASAPVSAK